MPSAWMHAAQAASPRLSSRSARAARVPQRVVAPLARDHGATTPSAAHRLVDDPHAARGALADHPTVEQDANHVAAEQARELNPRQSRCPRLRNSVEILHRLRFNAPRGGLTGTSPCAGWNMRPPGGPAPRGADLDR